MPHLVDSVRIFDIVHASCVVESQLFFYALVFLPAGHVNVFDGGEVAICLGGRQSSSRRSECVTIAHCSMCCRIGRYIGIVIDELLEYGGFARGFLSAYDYLVGFAHDIAIDSTWLELGVIQLRNMKIIAFLDVI